MNINQTEVIFADRIDSVNLGSGVVRLNFAINQPGQAMKDGDETPNSIISSQIVLPLTGFAESYGLLANMVEQLEKQGVLTRTQKTPEGADA
jgi:hypothetical protein